MKPGRPATRRARITPAWQQAVPLNDSGAWPAERDAATAERAQQAQERHAALNAAVEAIVPLQSQQNIALLAANVAATQARGLGAELQQRHTWDEAADRAGQGAQAAAEREIAALLPAQRVAA